ncbi:hypothetical protein L3Q82_013729 [Scortum barcoo]|uniref:Uncharacterized protein n=1 Tax=Scortum barcoo TaxID=214431 RepID=A0ACB8W1K0_9TELE|nr:hypothetical protein L3Q82_013729 [Scortum barcoo]
MSCQPITTWWQLKLDPLAEAEEEVGQSWQTQMYCEGLLGTSGWPSPLSGRSSTPTSRRASHRFQGRLGTLSPSGPCSLPPLSTLEFGSCGRKVSGACRGVATPEPGGGHRKYRQAKQAAALGRSWRQKLRVWEEFGEAMEEDYRSASKRFWQTVRHLRRGKQYSANTVYSESGWGAGELLTSTGDIVRWWKKYFEDLTDLPSSEEAEAGD